MAEFAFPPARPWLLAPDVAFLINIAIVVILLGSIVYLLRRPRRPASRVELVLGLSGVFATTLLARTVWGSVAEPGSPTDGRTQQSDVSFFMFQMLLIVLLNSACLARVGCPTDKPSYASGGFLTVSLIGVLMGWLLPAARNSQESARRSNCRGRLTSVLQATHEDQARRGRFCPPVIRDSQQPDRSWRVELLPYIDAQPLRKLYKDDEIWNGPSNSTLLSQRPRTYGCPSEPSDGVEPQQFTSYAMVTGETAFGTSVGRTPDEIPRPNWFESLKDDREKIAFVEACGRQIPWLEPRDVQLVDDSISMNQPGPKPGTSRSILSSYHPYGVNVALANGSTRTLSEKIDPAVLRALLTIPSREPAAIPDK